MRAQPLRPLLEALAAKDGTKNLAGEVTSAEKLFQTTALSRLDEKHAGVFVLFLFNRELDESIAKYLASDAVGNDTGANIFVLYEASARSRRRRSGGDDIPGVQTLAHENAMVEFARKLFPHYSLVLPGLVIVERLANGTSAVFVSLETGDSEDIVTRIRRLWAVIDEEWKARTANRTFEQSLGIRLAKDGFQYQRSEGISVQEQFVALLRVLWEYRRDLMALVPVVGRAFSAKAPEKPAE